MMRHLVGLEIGSRMPSLKMSRSTRCMQQRQGWLRIVAVLLCAGACSRPAVAATAEACDCNAIHMISKPICGSDGNTFMNRCLAVCQHVAVAHNGPCTASSGAAIIAADAASGSQMFNMLGAEAVHPTVLGMAAAAAATVALGFATGLVDAVVSREEWAKYADEGMVLVGMLRPQQNFHPYKLPAVDRQIRSPSTDPVTGAAAEVSVTPKDGCIYKRRMPIHQVNAARQAAQDAADVIAAGAASTLSAAVFVDEELPPINTAGEASFVPIEHTNGDTTVIDEVTWNSSLASSGSKRLNHPRKLLTIFGRDDRQQITGPTNFPFNAVGLINFNVDNVGKGCSGALIGPQAVLTAAHCVCSPTNQNITAAFWQFAPNHVVTGPDSRYGWASAIRYSFNTGFWTSDWWLWDIAVVIIDKRLGDKTGALGYAWSPDGVVGGLNTAGYPGDKPYGSFYRISADACQVDDTNGNNVLLKHKCDVYAGQSGSPMWDAQFGQSGQVTSRRVRAVINAETDDINSSMLITHSWFNFIKERRMQSK